MNKAYFESELKFILQKVEEYHPDCDREQISNAFWVAYEQHDGQSRESGEPYFYHPVEATKILLTINPDDETIQTCLLHDVLEDTGYTEKEMEEVFGATVLHLCKGVSKVAKVHLTSNTSGEKGLINLQKLFMAVAEDIRVIFVKLADRIHNLQTLESVPEYKQKRVAEESLKIYAPVCDKLGLHHFKNKIEDYSFKFQFPEMYKQISEEIETFKESKKLVFDRAYKELRELFEGKGVHLVDIHSRQKNLYSVYRKMKRKNFTSTKEMFDIFGFRVLVESEEDCYRVLGMIHANWNPLPRRFKDYIAVPKANGYQSIHTTLLGLGGSQLPTEIQIKTGEMHMDSEYGPAAHWAYKIKKSSHFDDEYLRKANWFPKNIPLESNLDPSEFYTHLSDFIFKDRVICFTPKGDIKTLTFGATAIDFAYAIHSEVGDMCVGAVVNGSIRPLDYPIQNGDVISVLTKKGKEPNPDWLSFVKTSHARTHIQAYLNKKNKDSDGNTPIKPQGDKPPERAKSVRAVEGRVSPDSFSLGEPDVIIGGNRNIPYHISTCCKPKIGNKIIAYKTRGLDYAIHSIDCRELKSLEEVRFMDASFCIRKRYQIISNNRIGLLGEFITLMGDCSLHILESEMKVESESNITTSLFLLEGYSFQDFHAFQLQIANIPEVHTVSELTKDEKDL